jgi:hypothetical protein
VKLERRKAFFETLLAASTGAQLKEALAGIGDHDTSSLDVPFGPHDMVWKAFGGNPSNVSSIGLGTKPGRSLTERITNAIDAILERRFQMGAGPQTSPKQAALAWYGRPISAADSGLYAWKSEPSGFDRQIHLVLLESGIPDCPTVDVLDHGVGLSSAEFPATILSLQAGNKIRKRHQIGAFGQGGSATLGFCSYAFIASRSAKNPSRIAFTVIRVLKLDASYKEDCFAYLAHKDGETSSVLEIDCGDDPFDIYATRSEAKVPPLVHGTLVRHINYRLSNLDKALHASPGNLYHYLHYSAFDPLIPFRVVDIRGDVDHTRNERISGSRNRLLARVAQAGKDDDEANIQIKHYRPMEFIVPHGSTEACIGVEYWVVLGFRKKGEEYELRGHSNELFVQAGHPIVGTLNGQNQGDLTSLLLKNIGLGLLSRHMVVHIDATEADSTVRRELFSTNREGFKDGPVLESILAMVKKILEDDERLKDLERELTERITRKETELATAEVKQAVSKLLREAGFAVKDPGKVASEGKGDKEQIERTKGPKPTQREPLPTLPYPQVTKFKIVYPTDVFQLPVNDAQSVIVETDADAQFNPHVNIRSEPPVLEIATRAPLRGGRVRWRLRPISGATAGAHGEVIASLTKPDGSQLTSKVLFELLPAVEKQARKNEGQIPPFDIIAVSPADSEIWEALWPEDGGDAVKQQEHAYKTLQTAGAMNVYFSTVFGPYKTALDSLKGAKPTRVPTFETHYQVWIGYHAILQAQRQQQPGAAYDGTSEEVVDRLQELERQTVGRVQVKQALKTAELLEATTKALEGG